MNASMGERKKEPTWLLKVFSSSSRGITTGRTAAFSSSPPSFDLSLTGMDKRWEGMEIFCQSVKSAKLRATNRGERKEGGGKTSMAATTIQRRLRLRANRPKWHSTPIPKQRGGSCGHQFDIGALDVFFFTQKTFSFSNTLLSFLTRHRKFFQKNSASEWARGKKFLSSTTRGRKGGKKRQEVWMMMTTTRRKDRNRFRQSKQDCHDSCLGT